MLTMFQTGSIPLLVFALSLWLLGGWLLARRAFDLSESEQMLTGFALGLVSGNWLANLVAQVLPLPAALWLSAFLVLAAGAAAGWPLKPRELLKSGRASIGAWLVLLMIVYVLWEVGRGLSIFDDYQNLPTVSILATGDVPPHFSLDPSLRFGYHYFLLFLAAQFMRLGNMYPFTALDLVRALTFGLAIVLAGMWARRLTASRLAGWLTGLVLAFTGGMRWLLLLFPASLLSRVAAQVTLMGSGLQSGADLAKNLTGPWLIDGDGPMQFPFAFTSGVHSPYVLAFGGFGVMHLLILLILLMTGSRWKHWSGGSLTVLLLASLALANEVSFAMLLAGGAVVLGLHWITQRTWRIPHSLLPWGAAALAALVIAGLQGGMLTEMVRNLFIRSGASYYDISFALAWPPMIVSSHLGPLEFNNIWKITAAFLEIGPIVLVLPWVIRYGLRAVREERWFEGLLAAAAVLSLLTIFIRYSGTGGITGTTRLLEGCLFACKLFAVPLLWIWARQRSERWQAGLLLAAGLSMLSGLILFGTALLAAGKPVHAYFLSNMDVQMEQRYWNRLEADALVFDPNPSRAPTVLGRFTDAFLNWYEPKAGWQALVATPDPYAMHAAGFDYMYYDIGYLESLEAEEQALLEAPCILLVEEITGTRNENDLRTDFRRLVDLRGCK